MNTQLNIDFSSAVIRPHNNRESEAMEVVHKKKRISQNQWVLEQLKNGRRLTGDIALAEYRIRDLRARIFTLKTKLKIDIKDSPIAGGMKEWYL